MRFTDLIFYIEKEKGREAAIKEQIYKQTVPSSLIAKYYLLITHFNCHHTVWHISM